MSIFDLKLYNRLPWYMSAEEKETIDQWREVSLKTKDVVDNIYFYGGPLLMFWGTVCNLLGAYLVVKSKVLWKNTMSIYILVLAILDTIILDAGILFDVTSDFDDFAFSKARRPAFAADTRAHVFYVDPFDYRVPIYLLLRKLFPMIEAWVLVCMCVERVGAVFTPLTYQHVFTKKRACIGLACVVVLCALFVSMSSLYLAYTSDSFIWQDKIEYNGPVIDKVVTQFKTMNKAHANTIPQTTVFLWVEMAVVSALPFLCMLILSITVLWKVSKTNKERKQFSTKTEFKVSHMTLIMLSMCLGFLLTTAPYSAFCAFLNYRVLHFFEFHYEVGVGYDRWCCQSYIYDRERSFYETYDCKYSFWVAEHKCMTSYLMTTEMLSCLNDPLRLLWYANFIINFYLYCLSNPIFRDELKKMFASRCTKLCLCKVWSGEGSKDNEKDDLFQNGEGKQETGVKHNSGSLSKGRKIGRQCKWMRGAGQRENIQMKEFRVCGKDDGWQRGTPV